MGKKVRKTKYVVSNYGLVLDSKKRFNNFIEQELDEDGYPVVELMMSGKLQKCRVDLLVAEAFLPNPEHKANVRHIDGNKENNFILNLEWV